MTLCGYNSHRELARHAYWFTYFHGHAKHYDGSKYRPNCSKHDSVGLPCALLLTAYGPSQNPALWDKAPKMAYWPFGT